jgi:hypothetical protein
MSRLAEKVPPPMLGADPEFFIGTDKKLISSIGVIGGEKGKGVSISPIINATWLEDNVAVEVNAPAYKSAGDFKTRWMQIMSEVKKTLAAKKMHAIIKPVVNFRSEELGHPKAHVYGCDPDFCAYDEDTKKPRVVDVQQFGNTRFAGGHLHLSFQNRDKIPAYAVAMIFDALVGLPAIMLDSQQERRKSYGLAGLFRTKKYADGSEGIEYRTLSNFWIKDVHQDPEATHMHYMAATALSIGHAASMRPMELSKFFIRLPLKDIQQTINKEDKVRARELLNFVKNVPEILGAGLDHSFPLVMSQY